MPEGWVEEITGRLVSEFRPEQIFLFGSRAWGDPDEESDLDLLIVVAESEERSSQRATRAHRCLRGIPIAMDLIVRTRREMDRSTQVRASLESEIVERGRILYDGRGEAGPGAELASQGVA